MDDAALGPTGTRAETARRRMTVEDLMKAGLSIRTISAGTGIPRSSVHRAMRAVARAEAKKQVAIA
jgi:DNA invertase Pin-like site-specific DNA recombinase